MQVDGRCEQTVQHSCRDETLATAGFVLRRRDTSDAAIVRASESARAQKNTLAPPVFRHKVRRGSEFATPAAPARSSRPLVCTLVCQHTLV